MSSELVRVNTRLPAKLNDKLDEESKETGLPKSTLIIMALNNYFQQKEAMGAMADIGQVLKKLDEMQEAFQEGQGGRSGG